MHRGLIGALIVLTLTVSAVPAGSAQTEWQVEQTIQFQSEPLDMVVTPRNRRVYVLNNQGEIHVYTMDGQLKGKIEVGPDVFQIKGGAKDDLLLLLKRNSNTMQAITIDVTENINLQGSPSKGEPDAPVAIAIFSDFQCPYCARLLPIFEQLLKQYPKQVKIVFKHFPLRNHKFAVKAAQATIAAHQQGKFWEFHDLLFEQYNQISDQKIEEIRSQLGLKADQFKKDMNAPQTMAMIREDAGNGRDAGVRGTPTVYINGKRLKDKTLKGFKQAITKALKSETGK